MTGEVARWRLQMGTGIGPWADHRGMVHAVDESRWLLLSGLPSPDVNLAMVYDADPAVLAGTLAEIDAMATPALVLLAGAGAERVGDLADPWLHVGEMPMMTIELASAPLRADPRVRPAGPEDREAVASLLADAYHMSPDVVWVCVDPLDRTSETMGIWVLEDDGVAVSTVTTTLTDDAVSIWCMATPERYGRRGYGRALLGAVLEHFHQQGVRTGLLGATPAGEPLYAASGWQHVERWQVFTNAASAQFSG
ncbi:GNAT family N-acetyltransferase [Nocardioides aquiterrae]|uniref:N-acetyltransferase domain-containing protein n=1 Tax=Nocardioides aquiterrae TaxID=203799 RepID=A0ABN1UFI7_9ACTN